MNNNFTTIQEFSRTPDNRPTPGQQNVFKESRA